MPWKAIKRSFIITIVLTLIFNTLGIRFARAATTTISESFQNATAPGWTLLGNAKLTEAEGGPDAGGAADGWLRLTDNDTDQVGASVYGTAVSSSSSIDIQFDHAVYNGMEDYSGADGFTFYMIAGTASPSLGAGGGDLGYVGITGAYFGVGFSEYGNDQVKIWGPSSGTPLVTVSTDPSNLIHTDGRDAKHIHITYSNKHISVWVAGAQVIDNFDISAYSAPATVKLGLSAATGGEYNIHEIRNFTATVETNPVVTLNPTSKDFGTRDLGTTSAAQEFTLKNDGSDDLVLGVLSLAGSDAGNFQLTATACNNATLPSNASCSFFVTHAPVEAGARSAAVSIPSNASTSPDSLTVSGTANCMNAILVTSNADGGAGSLRRAITNVCSGGTITFDADHTILLDSVLSIPRDMTIDGSGHAITVSGNDRVRVFLVPSGVNIVMNSLTVANGREQNGAGITSGGTITLTNSTLSGNYSGRAPGGGIQNTSTGTLHVSNSTFYNNTASLDFGGAIFNRGDMTITNSTFSGNTASNGGGAAIANQGTATLKNVIIANSTGANCNLVSLAAASTNNLSDDGSCGSSAAISTSILLGTLGDNGGSTQTFPLLPGSSAIDAGDHTTCAAAVGSPGYGAGGRDQRGVTRPQGAVCDIGAYELILYRIFLPLIVR